MADPRFFQKKGPFTLAELALKGECRLERGNPELEIGDVAPLETADSSCLTLFDGSPRYQEAFKNTKAGVCIISEKGMEHAPSSVALFVAKYPRRSFALIAQAFYEKETTGGSIDPTAVIHPTVKLGKGVTIGPMAVIEAYAEIGDHVVIGPLSMIGEGVVIGEGSVIASHVSISHTLIGKGVRVKPGARIGQQGFGFFRDTGDLGGHVDVPQLGRVILHDHVEIGSNTTIDRGSGHDTVIGMGTHIDNLVQIGHNVQLGKWCVIIAQSGIAGSTKFDDYVVAAAQSGVADNLKIGAGVRLAAKSGVMHNVTAGETLFGTPAMPFKTFFRQLAVLKQLAEKTRIHEKPKKRNVS